MMTIFSQLDFKNELKEQMKTIEQNIENLYKYIKENSFNYGETLYEDDQISFEVGKEVELDLENKTVKSSQIIIEGFVWEEYFNDFKKVKVFEIGIDNGIVCCGNLDFLWKLNETLLKNKN